MSDFLYNVPRGTIESYVELLQKWNSKINLVSYKDDEELYQRHIIDSLQLKKYIQDEEEVLDLGSGAGFPGLFLSYQV
jgi:16S rRNA (guanine527-N7)-methyltransferase